MRLPKMRASAKFPRWLVLLLGLVLITGLLVSCTSPESAAKSEGIGEDRILFALRSPGRHLVYSVNPGGTKLTKFLDIDTSFLWYPSLSPDRRYVAFFSSDGYLSILRMEDGEVTKLIKAAQEGEVATGYIAWSPSGDKITYTANRDLYVVNADGSGNKKLAEHKSGHYFGRDISGTHADQIRNPIWSADGNHILFDDFRAPDFLSVLPYESVSEALLKARVRAIYAVSVTTSEEKELVSQGRLGDQALDRTKVLIETGYRDWSVMNVDGSIQETPELPEDLIECKWSPDGSMIVTLDWLHELSIINALTGERISVAGKIEDIEDLVWSPDSRHIAYTQADSDEIHIVRRDLSHGFAFHALKARGDEEILEIKLIAWLS